MITPMGMRWTVHLARKKENTRWYNILDGNHEGKRSLERPIRWCENIKTNLREIRFGSVDCIHVDQDMNRRQTLLNTVIDFRFP